MSFLLNKITSKTQLDHVIKTTNDVVLVLRFGKESDTACLVLDDIIELGDGVVEVGDRATELEKTSDSLRKMAMIYTVDVETVPLYTQYFDISLIPSTIFFFNAQHIKVDWGTPDQTKFIGSFKSKQDFIDVIEVIYRGAMRGKVMIQSPLDPRDVPKYELIYKDI